MKRTNVFIVILVVVILISTTAFALSRANPIIRYCRAGLMADKTAVLSVAAKVSCQSIGSIKCILYNSQGGIVETIALNDYGTGKSHVTTVDLSSYISNGNSYYVKAYFSADGETANVTSGTRTY